MKNSSDTIGNRNRNLPACSAVPQPTAPPRAPRFRVIIIIIIIIIIIDVAIPADRNVVQKGGEKKLKCKSLCIEIQRMWNLKCTILPVITGATGIVTRSLEKKLEAVPGKHSIDSLQKTAILGTSHIIRKALQCEA